MLTSDKNVTWKVCHGIPVVFQWFLCMIPHLLEEVVIYHSREIVISAQFFSAWL